MNGIISFSVAPLRMALIAGFMISGLSLLYAISMFFLALFGLVNGQAGIPTVIVAFFFFGGFQLFFLGMLGEYTLAIYNQIRHKPLVIVRKRVNFDTDLP